MRKLLLALALLGFAGTVQAQPKDGTGSPGIFTADIGATGTLGALNATVTLTLAGRSGVGFHIATNNLQATVCPQTSVDGTTWTTISGGLYSPGDLDSFISPGPPSAGTCFVFTGSGPIAGDGTFNIEPGTAKVRLKVTAYTGGTTTSARLNATAFPLMTLMARRSDLSTQRLTMDNANNLNVNVQATNGDLALEGGGNLDAINANTFSIDSKIPASPSTDRTTAGGPFSVELSDGAAFYTGTKTGQLPAALDGGGFLKVHEQGTAAVSGTVAVSSVTTSVVPGTAATNLGKAEDAAHSSGDVGVQMLTKRTDSAASSAGTDGDYATANTDANGLLWVNGSGVTQPISGTVTVSGLSGTSDVNVKQMNGTTTDTNSGNKSAGTVRVVIATDQPALTNKLLVTPDLPSGASTAAKQPALGTAGTASTDVITVQGIAAMTPLLVTPAANSAVNVAQVAGTATDVNSGTKSAGTIRVVLATDQPALTNKLLVTPDSVALPANQSVNVAQLAGTTTDTNSGSKSAGTLRVVLATDQPALTNALSVAPTTSTTASQDGVCTSVSTNTTVLASSAARLGAIIHAQCDTVACNTDVVFVKYAATATTADYPLGPGETLNLTGVGIYTGIVDAIANSGTQKLCIISW